MEAKENDLFSIKQTDTFAHLDFDNSDIRNIFNFLCPNCESKHIEMIPINIPFRSGENDNEDLIKEGIKNKKDLMEYFGMNARQHLNNLPTKIQAIKECASKNNLVIFCNACSEYHRVMDRVEQPELARWIQKNIGSDPVFLGSRI